MNENPKFLLIDDETISINFILGILKEEGYCISIAKCAEEAEELLQGDSDFDIVLLDMVIPIKKDGMDEPSSEKGLNLLEFIRKDYPLIPVIMISGYSRGFHSLEAMEMGAFHFFDKPLDEYCLKACIRNAIQFHHLEKQVVEYKCRNFEMAVFPCISPSFKTLILQIKKIAVSDCNVLINGESGVGKEVVAGLIHYYSPRKDKEFYPYLCPKNNPDLTRSELFGQKAGAFTGAKDRTGIFEFVNGGTVFLDEIGNLSAENQALLLRYLQDKHFIRVGESKIIKSDVRIISATNANLSERIKAGDFREDLFFRLNTTTINVPPLRERREDIFPLAQHFLKESCKRRKVGEKILDEDAKPLLENTYWRGNVRELQTAMERISLNSEFQLVGAPEVRQILKKLDAEIEHAQDLIILPAENLPEDTSPIPILPLEEVTSQTEKQYLKFALQRFQGNISKTAEALKIDRKKLYALIDKYHIEIKEFR